MNKAIIQCPPELLFRSIRKATGFNIAMPERQRLISNFVGSRSGCAVSLHPNKVASDPIFQRRFYKAAVCTELKKPMTIAVKESQKLDPGEVRIQVAAAGVNFGDLLMVTGEYQVKLPLPFTGGNEMSGTVLEVGEDVKSLKPGMRVAGTVNKFGAFAEEVVTQSEYVWVIPDQMSFKEAAGFICSYGTAMMGLHHRANLKEGENVLVTAAAGAVGLAAVDIASNVFKANVIGAAGSDEKCELVKSKGASEVINYRNESIRDKMREICPGGANVVFEAVGGSAFKDSLRSIAWEGRLLVVGFASGDIPQIPANHLLVKNVSAVGLYWGAYSMANMDLFRWSVDRCFEEYKAGKIKPHIGAAFDLSQINNAFAYIKDRKSTGKVVIET